VLGDYAIITTRNRWFAAHKLQSLDLSYNEASKTDPNSGNSIPIVTHKVGGIAKSIEFFGTGATGQSVVHEALHTVTTAWDGVQNQNLHQRSFDDAAKKILP
jgi:hypothetical protein